MEVSLFSKVSKMWRGREREASCLYLRHHLPLSSAVSKLTSVSLYWCLLSRRHSEEVSCRLVTFTPCTIAATRQNNMYQRGRVVKWMKDCYPQLIHTEQM